MYALSEMRGLPKLVISHGIGLSLHKGSTVLFLLSCQNFEHLISNHKFHYISGTP